jgi:hypothetical protein
MTARYTTHARIPPIMHAKIFQLSDKKLLDNRTIVLYTGTMKKSSFAIPLVGSVQAGFPSPEEEALCDIMSMDEYLVTKPDSSFLLKERIMKTCATVTVRVSDLREIRQPRSLHVQIAWKRHLYRQFRHFIETTDWEKQFISNRVIDKICLFGIMISYLYFTTCLLSFILK